MPKFRTPFFPGQTLLLSTTVLNDIIHMIFLFQRATAKLRGYPVLKPT